MFFFCILYLTNLQNSNPCPRPSVVNVCLCVCGTVYPLSLWTIWNELQSPGDSISWTSRNPWPQQCSQCPGKSTQGRAATPSRFCQGRVAMPGSVCHGKGTLAVQQIYRLNPVMMPASRAWIFRSEVMPSAMSAALAAPLSFFFYHLLFWNKPSFTVILTHPKCDMENSETHLFLGTVWPSCYVSVAW